MRVFCSITYVGRQIKLVLTALHRGVIINFK